MGAELYPDFNVFEVARPYARELMLDRFKPGRLAARVRTEARSLGRVLVDTPHQLSDILEEFRDGEVEIGVRTEALDVISQRLDPVVNRVVVAIVAAAGVVGSSILASFGDGFLHVVAGLGFGLSLVLGFWLVWGVIRSGRI